MSVVGVISTHDYGGGKVLEDGRRGKEKVAATESERPGIGTSSGGETCWVDPATQSLASLVALAF